MDVTGKVEAQVNFWVTEIWRNDQSLFLAGQGGSAAETAGWIAYNVYQIFGEELRPTPGSWVGFLRSRKLASGSIRI